MSDKSLWYFITNHSKEVLLLLFLLSFFFLSFFFFFFWFSNSVIHVVFICLERVVVLAFRLCCFILDVVLGVYVPFLFGVFGQIVEFDFISSHLVTFNLACNLISILH